MRIGFIGLGTMGHSMAANILAKNGGISIWNRTAEKGDDLVSAGAAWCDTPKQVAEDNDIVCICVADTPDVEAVMFGDAGAHQGMKDGKLAIDFSTISAEATEEFAGRLADNGATWVDAPVSGGDVGAKNGTLTIMAGGTAEDFARAEDIFRMVGKAWFHMGPVGSGQRTKLANQIAVAGSIAAMSEALVFAQELGMDVEKVHAVLSGGAAGSWSMSNYGPRILRGDLNPGFSAALQSKDLRLVVEAMKNLGGEYWMTKRMAEIYADMAATEDGKLGNHGAIKRFGWKA